MPRPRRSIPDEIKATTPPEMVDHPAHYSPVDDGVECIEAIRSELGRDGFIAWLRGEITKYNWRLLRKGDPVEDCAKLIWYGEKLAEILDDAV